DNGATGVCNIDEALQDPVTSGALFLGIGLGTVAVVLGVGTYRRMDSNRRRADSITGAVLGAPGVVLEALPQFRRPRGLRGCLRSGGLQHAETGIRRRARRDRDRARSGRPDALVATSGACAGPDL